MKKPKWADSIMDLPILPSEQNILLCVLLSKNREICLVSHIRLVCVVIFNSEKCAKLSTLSCCMQPISFNIPKVSIF